MARNIIEEAGQRRDGGTNALHLQRISKRPANSHGDTLHSCGPRVTSAAHFAREVKRPPCGAQLGSYADIRARAETENSWDAA